MRIPPNTHPVIRIRNTLLTAASLFAIWLLLCLASCSNAPVASAETAPETYGSVATASTTRPPASMLAPTGPIQLVAPFVRIHAGRSTRT